MKLRYLLKKNRNMRACDFSSDVRFRARFSSATEKNKLCWKSPCPSKEQSKKKSTTGSLHTIRHVRRSVWLARETKPRFSAALERSAHDWENCRLIGTHSQSRSQSLLTSYGACSTKTKALGRRLSDMQYNTISPRTIRTGPFQSPRFRRACALRS